MSKSIERKTVNVVSKDAMLSDTLFRMMTEVTPQEIDKMVERMNTAIDARDLFDSQQIRAVKGIPVMCNSADIQNIRSMKFNTVIARGLVALAIDPMKLFAPMLCSGGKGYDQSSSLKAYEKLGQILDCIYTGTGKLQGVVKVWSVCAYLYTKASNDVLERTTSERFLNSYEFRSIKNGSSDLMNAIEEIKSIRKTTMSNGDKTQTSQMVRMLVALRAATDVQRGNSKDIKIHTESLVMQSLMKRLGMIKIDPIQSSQLMLTDQRESLLDDIFDVPESEETLLLEYHGLDEFGGDDTDSKLIDADFDSVETEERDVYAWFDAEDSFEV